MKVNRSVRIQNPEEEARMSLSSDINAQAGEVSKATKFRLVTRSDFDGLVCAVLLKHMDMIDDILFVHPKDMQDGKVEITNRDITTNLPYVEGVHMAFDHHLSETIRNKDQKENHIIHPEAMSAARVVYDYFGGLSRFPERWNGMMDAVDKADAAQFSLDEILNPSGWVLLNYLMDPRTGLGRFRNFRISNYNLMMNLIDYCKDHDIDEIMQISDVVERVELYTEQAALFKEQVGRCSNIYQNLLVLDLRNEETIYAGNRFMIYALHPECNISIHVLWGLKQQNTVFAIGKSIVNRSSKTNVGELCLQYGGGGHEKAGTCQIDNDKAEDVLKELIKTITTDG
jgi:nanoRNase/pAp phosphatase (c-di-AMP/oligoRNAs hydrolase)